MQQEYEVEQDISRELNERLRMETGWNDVVSGLGKVLLGYLIFIIGAIVGTGLIVGSAVSWIFAEGARAGGLPPMGAIWMLWIGLGILSVVGTWGYLTIIAGQWMCLHGASERHGARWMMFFCLTALLAIPALDIASGIGGNMQRGPDLNRGAIGFREMRFTKMARFMQLASAASGLMYSVFFLLFLRAVARCHASPAHVALVNLYLIFVAGLVAVTVGVAFLGLRGKLPPGLDPVLWLGGAWVVCFLFYLFLIGAIRSCITRSLARVKSPLDM
jgi:hypothetical protein